LNKDFATTKRARGGKPATPFRPVKFEMAASQLQKSATKLRRRHAAEYRNGYTQRCGIQQAAAQRGQQSKASHEQAA